MFHFQEMELFFFRKLESISSGPHAPAEVALTT